MARIGAMGAFQVETQGQLSHIFLGAEGGIIGNTH